MNREFDKNFDLNSLKQFRKKNLKDNELVLSQKPFYTIQGEGAYSGSPCVFVRTSHCILKCHFCSVGETLIMTDDLSEKYIKDIQIGDIVLSRNTDNLDDTSLYSNKVLNILTREVEIKDMIVLVKNSSLFGYPNSNKLIVTKDHLFLTSNREWKKAEDFIAGEKFEHPHPFAKDKDLEYYIKETRELNEEEIKEYSENNKIKVYSLTLEDGFKSYFTNKLLSHNCDEESWDKYRMQYSFEDIYNAMQELNKDCQLQIFSGGEPALQLSSSYIKFFNDKGIKINIETSGSYWNEAMTELNFVCCSPKKVSDQAGKLDTKKDSYIIDERIIPHVDEFKFIIEENTNEEMLMSFINKYKPHTKESCRWYLSPMDSYNEEQNKKNREKLLSLTLSYPRIFKISMQMHKWLNVL